MPYQTLINKTYKKLHQLSEKKCFEEVYNIINSLEPIDAKMYKEACGYLGLEIGESGFCVINHNNSMSLAAITLMFCSLSEDDSEYPIFFNHQRENILVQHLQDDTYVLKEIESEHNIEEETRNSFYESFRTFDGGHIADLNSILFLVNKYNDIGDLSVALSDYTRQSRGNEKLLCNFSVNKVNFLNCDNNTQATSVLRHMFNSQRLDTMSFNCLSKAIQGNI